MISRRLLILRLRNQRRLSGQGCADGVECGELVGGGGVQVAAGPAPPGESRPRVPVPRDGSPDGQAGQLVEVRVEFEKLVGCLA
jgi:hypothetical protein